MGPTLVVLITLQDALQQFSFRNLEGKSLLVLGRGDYKAYQGHKGTSGWGEGKSNRDREQGASDFVSSFFIGEFKTMRI